MMGVQIVTGKCPSKSSLIFSRLLLSKTVDQHEFPPITIWALWFQVKAYQNFGFVSDWLIEKKIYKIDVKDFLGGGRVVQSVGFFYWKWQQIWSKENNVLKESY